MSTRNLDKLFNPKSIAVVGASSRPGAVGMIVMRNLLEGGFNGPIMPVNPNRSSVAGVIAYPSAKALPIVPDCAVVCVPPKVVPQVIKDLCEIGTRAAIILTAGLTSEKAADGRSLQDHVMETARAVRMRILGPNCLGLLVPGIKLNASFSHMPAIPGKIAFCAQSGALATAVLDWAQDHDVGFSHFISMGDATDLDFGDVIDYLGSSPEVRAILLYIESIKDARTFVSAARAASRNKPILAIKSGRVAEGAKAAASHTGALAGADNVYDAAIARSGALRVYSVDELFSASETLARSRPLKGENVCILTNGGGAGVLAVDALIESGGKLANLSPETIAKLNAVLPDTWSHANPVDIIGDAPRERYLNSMEILAQAPEVDIILSLHCPTATASSSEAADAIIQCAKQYSCTTLTSWIGGRTIAESRRMFRDNGIPTYETPEMAVQALMHMVRFRRNQELLTQTPKSLPDEFEADVAKVRGIIDAVIAEGRDMLTEFEAKAVLMAYRIPTVRTEIVRTPDEAAEKAAEIGFPVALKILSHDITHKSDAGGVRLFLDSPEIVKQKAESMLKRIGTNFPNAKLDGFTVQQMAVRPGAYELLLGSVEDVTFGPTIMFGHGGTAVEVIGDSAIGIPPLNTVLAEEMVSRTRISKLLKGYRDQPPIDSVALHRTLICVSQLIVDFGEIIELDVNPLLADDRGVLVVDARIRVHSYIGHAADRLAIRPYPKELEEEYKLPEGRIALLRPIQPEDEPAHYDFMSKLTPQDIRFRFFGSVRELPHSEMARLTQIDYDREMAFIATIPRKTGEGRETLGVVRTVTDLKSESAEFAIVVRSDLQDQGLGSKLLDKMIAYCRDRGTKAMVGQVMDENVRMLALARSNGFSQKRIPDDRAYEVTLLL